MLDLEPIERHERIVLEFSGGRDSLAALAACEPFWHKIVVAWGNRGAEFPEVERIAEWVRKDVPVREFVEVRPPLPHELSMRTHGQPVDLLPLRMVPAVAELTGQGDPPIRLQSYIECCNRLLWQPLERFRREYGATLLIRGQRNAETMKSPVRSGDVIDGVEYLFPLEDMGAEEVDRFLARSGWELPSYYDEVSKSLDCWSCTAYLHESVDQLAYTKNHHPGLWGRLKPRLQAVAAATTPDVRNLHAARRLTED